MKFNTRDIFIIALFIVIIFLLLKRCNGGGGSVSVKSDTVFVQLKQDTSYIPKYDTMYFTRTKINTVPYYKFDTLYLPPNIDTLAILKDYHATLIYKDTIPNKYGVILITDTVTKNRITGRGIATDFKIPEITKTITLTQPKRAQVYVGAGLLGNERELLSAYEVNLSLKTRNDQIIGVGYQQFFGGDGLYKLEYRRKISFRK